MTKDKKFSIEVVVTRKLRWRNMMKSFLSLGFSEFPELIKDFGKYYCVAYRDGSVFLEKYRNNKFVENKKLLITASQLQEKLSSKSFNDEAYTYRFLTNTLKTINEVFLVFNIFFRLFPIQRILYNNKILCFVFLIREGQS